MLAHKKSRQAQEAEKPSSTSARSRNPEFQPNKHQQKTEETRRRLLRSARRIFARDGFEAARIEDIASDAGYTRGAFYAHFKVKEDLFFALLEHQVAEKMQRLRVDLQASNSSEERVGVLREYYGNRVIDKQWSILMLEFKLFAIRHPRMKARLLAAQKRIRSSIQMEELKDLLPAEWKGHSPAHDIKGRSLEGILHGLVLEHAYDPTTMPEQQVSSTLRAVFDTIVKGSHR